MQCRCVPRTPVQVARRSTLPRRARRPPVAFRATSAIASIRRHRSTPDMRFDDFDALAPRPEPLGPGPADFCGDGWAARLAIAWLDASRRNTVVDDMTVVIAWRL